MSLTELITELQKHDIAYLGKVRHNKYLFTDNYLIFVIAKDADRYATNLSYVDICLRQWQNKY